MGHNIRYGSGSWNSDMRHDPDHGLLIPRSLGVTIGEMKFYLGIYTCGIFFGKEWNNFFSFKICKLLCKKVVTCVGWVCNSAPKLVCALFFKQRCESSEPICYLSYKSPIRVFFRVYTLITWEKSWSKLFPKLL